jgi:hypothetical protein
VAQKRAVFANDDDDYISSDILTAMTIILTVVCDRTPCSLVDIYRRTDLVGVEITFYACSEGARFESRPGHRPIPEGGVGATE